MVQIPAVPPALQPPWLAKDAWAKGRITSSSGGHFVFLSLFAIVWNGFIGLLLLVAGRDMLSKFQQGEHAIALILLFPAAGMLVAGLAVQSGIAWLKFGTSTFVMDAIPGVIGGHLRGRIESRMRAVPDADVRVTLTSLHVRRIRSGKETRTEEQSLWEAEETVPPSRMALGAEGVVIPVSLHIPYGLRSSSEDDPSDRIVWRLAAYCDVPGVDYSPTFEVPVFVTADSREETEAERQARLDAVAAPDESGLEGWAPPVDIQPTGDGGVELSFRPQFKTSDVVKSTLFAIVFGAVTATLLAYRVIACLPIGTGLLTLLVVVAVAVMCFGKSRVRIQGGEITIVKSMFGINSTKRFPCADVVRVGVQNAIKNSSSQNQRQRSWEIALQKDDGTFVDTGTMFNDRRFAEWLAARMEKLILAQSGQGPATESEPDDPAADEPPA